MEPTHSPTYRGTAVTRPDVPSTVSGKRQRSDAGAASSEDLPDRKRACWGILTSQAEPVKGSCAISVHFIGPGSWADRSPLHEAASQGRLLALRTLLSQGYHANIMTIDYVTPLHEACLSGHVSCIRALIRVGANVNAATIDGVTPLFNCSSSGSEASMEVLLQNGAHTHTTHTHLPSALHEACKRGHSVCVQLLLAYGADPDYSVSHLGSPLYISCLHGHTSCTRLLLHTGARVNEGPAGESPLLAAARHDSSEQVALLLEYGADVNLRDTDNHRAVELAPPGGKTEELLLAYDLSPRSLRQMCRVLIRDLIGRSRMKFLPQLPLPPLITQYLQYT